MQERVGMAKECLLYSRRDILMAYHVTSRPQKPGESARVTYSSVTHICRSDGCQEITFILDGFTRGSWLSLEKYKQKIEQNIERTAILASGAGVAVFYGNASPVPTGDAELKRIQINLTIKEYKNGR